MKKFICIFMLLILAVLSVSCDATAKTNTTDTSKESTGSTGSTGTTTNEDVTEAEEADSVIEYNLEFNSGRVVNITLPSRFTVGDVTSDYSDFGYLSEECNIFEDDQLVGFLNLTETTDMWDSEEIAQNFLEETPNPRAIYQGLMTGTMSTWDVNYKVIYQTDTEGTAVSLIACSFSSDEERDKDWIRTAQPFLDEGDDPRYYYDKAILGYHADRMERYTAIRFKYEAISDKEAENIAESLRIVLGEG
ncbi:hypothetical protein FACS1894219_09860 [Clostridia bacterium]|nr:hypothetical protein FACS1894219_09860 [Clostridia bacterium]